MNKLHVISGLLQIGETQKAIAFINGVSEDVEDNIGTNEAESQVDYSTGGRPRVEYRSL